jgi:PAS domain S-box-containing protein
MPEKSVLCIDDDAIFRETVRDTLEEAGYGFISASSGREGLERFFEDYPQAVLVDLKMPDMGGLEVLSTVVEHSPEVPVIVVSGAGDMSDVISALRLGAWDFVIKSLRNISLLDLHLDRALDKARLVRENRLYQESLEKALREKDLYRRNLEITFKNIPDGIATVDAEGRLQEYNEAMENICGSHCDLTSGADFHTVFSAEMNECADALDMALANGKRVRDMRLEWPHLGDNGLVVELTAAPILEDDGARTGAILLVRDVTRQADLEERLKKKHRMGNIIGKSRKMQQVFTLVRQLGSVDTSVLVTGESGTGKELVADALHYNGDRRNGPLVKVNCSALSENLLDSELFGHVRGAFTGAVRDKVGRFEAAHGGTILLDEIGDISPMIQLKLLRVLDTKQYERVGDSATREVDVRVVAATNVNLQQKVRDGQFRQDLYYRLKVMPVHLPPLRERREDIPLLVRHFLSEFAAEFDKDITGVSEKVMNLFMRYEWPGNVRELKHAMEHACLLCSGGVIVMEHLPADLTAFMGDGRPSMPPGEPSNIDKRDILDAIERADGNKSKAARLLGVNRKTLYRKMHKLGVPIEGRNGARQGRSS